MNSHNAHQPKPLKYHSILFYSYFKFAVETAHRAIEAAIAKALGAAGVPRAAVQQICLGMSGVDCPADIELVSGWVR